MPKLPPRLQTLTDSLDGLGIDAMLVTDETNVRYLCGFTGDSTYLLVSSQSTVILSDGRYETQLAQQCPTLPAIIRSPSEMLPKLTQSALQDGGYRRVGIEADHLTLDGFRRLTAPLGEIQWVETTGQVQQQRMIKDDVEIKITREAVRIAEQAWKAMRENLNPEWTEQDLAYRLEAEMRSLGAEGCSFAPIIAAGAAGALPHYEPATNKLGSGTTMLVDWGAKYEGYASDLTRTFYRDQPSDRFRKAYEVVLEAQLTAIDAIKPGAAASDVDAAARGVIEKAGMGEAFKHGLGHGVGLYIHEFPRLSSSSAETLEAGMIITVEPGVYFEGDFGIRIEDDVLITAAGNEVLSSLPKGLDDSCLIL
ncbi:MAG: Xaa-Pro peptidase family protein [Rubripirellula sp.]|nr:Xaa-Pro peptidase family protein [Rubripirellula sp.]